MASRSCDSTALAVALLSLLLLSNAAPELDASAEKADAAATTTANPVLRLPSDRLVVPVEERLNPVEQAVPLPGSKTDDHQDADGSSTAVQISQQDPSSTAETTTTFETAEPATAIPSLKVSLIPILRNSDADGLNRVHLKGTRVAFWFMRPRHHHHSRLFHQLFLDGRPADVAQRMKFHLGGEQHRAAEMMLRRGFEVPLLPQETDQQQEHRVLTFRIRRLGPHHYHDSRP